MKTYGDVAGVHSEAEDAIMRASKVTQRMDAAVIGDGEAVTYTPAQILGGLIVRDCNGGARTDVLPTAVDLIGALRAEQVGDIIECTIINNSDGVETITLDAGVGGDWTQIAATRIIPQNTSRKLYLRVTGVSTPAYIAYM